MDACWFCYHESVSFSNVNKHILTIGRVITPETVRATAILTPYGFLPLYLTANHKAVTSSPLLRLSYQYECLEYKFSICISSEDF